MNEHERDVLRPLLIAAMSEWSESNYAAGWLIDLDFYIWKSDDGTWEDRADLLGWPLGVEGNLGWVTWKEAGEWYAATTAEQRYRRAIEAGR